MTSPLQNAITFFKDFGLFDVVLPFLLIFALIFAILEKTKILGTEKVKGEDITKRNLNTIIAFVIAMLVVATNKVVTAINTALPNIVFIIVAFVAFLLMVGVFFPTGELNLWAKKEHAVFAMGFMVFSLVALVIIILDSIKLDSGKSWLSYILEYALTNFSGPIVMSIIFLVVALVAIGYVTSNPKKE